MNKHLWTLGLLSPTSQVLIEKGDNMAKQNVFLAGVCDAYVYSGDQLLFTSKALTDSSINISVSPQEIRAGKGNKLLGRLFTDSSFGLTLQDALFNLDVIAENAGSIVTAGLGSALKEEQITATGEGKLAVTGVPQDFLGYGVIGWISKPGESDWAKFVFDDGAATAENVQLADGSLIQSGEVYCTKYFNQASVEEVIIPGEIVPGEVTVVLDGNLYRASQGGASTTSASVVGHLQILVPRFQMEGTMEISLQNGGASNIPFSGQALLTSDGAEACESGGYYAKITEIMTDADWTDGLVTIACDAAEPVVVAPDATKKINIYGVFANGTSKLLAPELLAFVMDAGTATGTTVDANGVITAGSVEGDGVLSVTVNDKTSVKASINVSVVA